MVLRVLIPSALLITTGVWLGREIALSGSLPSVLATLLGVTMAPAAMMRLALKRNSPTMAMAVWGLIVLGITFTFTLHCAFLIEARGVRGPLVILVVSSGVIWPMVMIVVAVRQGSGLTPSNTDVTRAAAPLSLVTQLGVLALAFVGVGALRPILEGAPPVVAFFAIVMVASLADLIVGEVVTWMMLKRSHVLTGDLAKSALEITEKLGVRLGALASIQRGQPAQVRTSIRFGPVLFFEPAFLASLPPEEFRAIVAHEAAHVRHKHLAKLNVLAVLLSVGLGLGLVSVYRATMATALGLGAATVSLVLMISVTRQLLLLACLRRFEYEADATAASAVGKGAVLSALGRSRGLELAAADISSVWMTHPSVAERSARIEAADE